MEASCSRFTPAEGGARLAAAASEKNILAVEYPAFIATRLVYEHAYKIRGSLFDGRQRSVHVTRASRVESVAYDYRTLTDLSVSKAVEYADVYDWYAEMDSKEVIVCTSQVLKQILEEEIVNMTNLNVLIIESCHLVHKDDNLKYILKLYKDCEEDKKPRILALTYPLFLSTKKESDCTQNKDVNQNENSTVSTDQNSDDSATNKPNEPVDDSNSNNKTDVKNNLKDNIVLTTSETDIDIIDNSDKTNTSEELSDDKRIKTEEKEHESIENAEKTSDLPKCSENVSEAQTTEKVNIEECNDTVKLSTVKREKSNENLVEKNNDSVDTNEAKPNEETEAKTEDTIDKTEDNNIDKRELESANNDKDKIKKEVDDFGVYENLDDFEMYEKLEWKIEELEQEVCCQMDLAEDIDGGKRLSATLTKPKEMIIEYSIRPSTDELPAAYVELEQFMIDTVYHAMEFLDEHRFDPIEIYGEDFIDELKNVPDPKIVPKYFLKQFLYVLEQLGPYAADKLAFSLLVKIEKLRVKEKYDRHFLLLCLLTTVFVKIRCYTDTVFSSYSDWEKIQLFSTPKLMRFVEILEKFQPTDCDTKTNAFGNNASKNTDSGNKDSTAKMLNDIEKCDFMSLSNKIEDAVNTYEANLKEIVLDTNSADRSDSNISENKSSDVTGSKNKVSDVDDSENKVEISDKSVMWLHRRPGGRSRGRGRTPRTNAARVQQMQQNPDALCGIVFMKEALMAKTMFLLIVDMSRCNPRLSYLCVQYCAVDRPTDPCADDTKRQGKKHEDVLKKFRMHECNLLLATSALEEGIDLPRCNLVLRWDVPASYRSFALCRSRARAARAAAPLLAAAGPAAQALKAHLAAYCELDQIISRKCGCGIQNEPPQSEEDHADAFTGLVKPYSPQDKKRDKSTEIPRTKLITSSNYGKIVANYEAKPIDTEIDLSKLTINESADRINKSADGINESTTVIHESVAGMNESATGIHESAAGIHESAAGINGSADRINDKCKCDSNKIPNDSSSYNNGNVIDDLLQPNKPSQPNGYIEVCNSYFDAQDVANTVTNIEESTKSDIVAPSCDSDVNIDISKNVFSGNSDSKTNINSDINMGISKDISEISLSNNSTDKKESRNDKGFLNASVSDKTTKSVNHSVPNMKISSVRSDNRSENSKIDRIVDSDIPNVDLSTAIPLINRYCAKLPSDTFTRLAPQWWTEEVRIPTRDGTLRNAYICTLRLPLNCPVKYNIVGHPMKTRVLARRMVALQACRILHKSGELDDQLMPIGKENFKAAELECNNNFGDTGDPNDVARPGTTKRRQYYYKRTAFAFTDCQPVIDTSDSQIDASNENLGESDVKNVEVTENRGKKRNMLYAIVSKLSCALPERYNTRGRRLHAPQHAKQAIGILMARDEPDDLQIPAFPVYTRSGEVRVSVELVPDADVRMSPRRDKLVRRFMRFVFAEVLRVHRRGMKLQNEGSTHNNYYVVPTIKLTKPDGTSRIDIDWAFLELIYQHTEEKKHLDVEKPLIWQEGEKEKPDTCEKEKEDGKVKEMENPLLKAGEVFEFDAEKYKEAVVTPWYRNQDQPQFFLVAEICWNLTPDSAFPSATHSSFRNYYSSKYGVVLTQSNQPLLDVDHTSARLNLLTPRYVNRKGVALPVSSERTRRAKRDRLDQKQILVPELCRVHPFAAPLWFATVALPCVLYRINALLIADEIRRAVAIDVGLGIPKIDEHSCPGFQWPPLDFGWSLAEVLSADSDKSEKKKDGDTDKKGVEKEDSDEDKPIEEVKKEVEDNDGSNKEEQKEKTINDILQEKENAESSFEIGTWSNDMAYNIPQGREFDEFMEPLPANVTLVTSESGGLNWSDKPKSQFNPPRDFSMADSDCSYMSSDFDTDTDSDDNYDTDSGGFGNGKINMTPSSFRIEYKTAHEAEAFDIERKKVNPAPQPDAEDDARDRAEHEAFMRNGEPPVEHIEKFRKSVAEHEKAIVEKGHLITKDQPITELLPEVAKDNHKQPSTTETNGELLGELFPYKQDNLEILENGQISLESIEKNKRLLLNELKKTLSMEEIKKLKCFSMVDVDIDAKDYVNEKVVNVGFDTKDIYEKKISHWDSVSEFKPYYEEGKMFNGKDFDFDYQPKLEGHPGPSPSVILQALTMSNANDGINLERLETIGDSFLKFAITAYLYCAHPTVHEGKLSHMRSKQVSNLNLYRLGRNKRLGARMIASKFEPHDNWLPPCHKPPPTLHPKGAGDSQEQAPVISETPLDSTGCFIPYNLITQHSIPDKSIADCVEALIGAYLLECGPRGALLFMSWLGIRVLPRHELPLPDGHPYVSWMMARKQGREHERLQKPESHLQKRACRDGSDSESERSSDEELETDVEQHQELVAEDWSWPGRPVGSLRPYRDENGRWMQPIFGELKAPPSPLLRYIEDPEGELEQMLSGYDALERTLQYRFKDRSLLLQALTHASHQNNRLTDCYQRLEFLGDAILDYLITRHLYEEPRRHSPGALTDLRSALVNNTIFATLAARHGFHKYFRHMSPGLNEVLTKYVKIQEENGHSISEEHYLIQEDEMEQAEDVEVPKALGDLFESVAGAIFLDSGMSLSAVWKSYVNLMGAELEAFSAAAPKSPVRELLEAEPDTAKFGKPERLADGRRVRVSVEVFGRGTFKGIGRNYRIAKGTAARCALRHLRLLHKGR